MLRTFILPALLLALVACENTVASTEADGGEIGTRDANTSSKTDASPTADAAVGQACGMPSSISRVDFLFEGENRGATIHLPAGYDGSSAHALVLNFHGRNSTTDQQRLLSKMDEHADASGYIAVYPEGIGNTFNAGFCCGEAQTRNINDVGYTRKLVEELEAVLCIDSSKTYATGLSNGGYMVQRLACEASDIFAGFSSVAGLLAVLTCQPQVARPIVHFHGTADTIVPYNGGGFLTSASDTMEAWATRNGCNTSNTTVYDQGDASCIRYNSCPAGQNVEFCTIDGGGHTWPGGLPIPGLGNTSTDISANEYMWQFFEANN